MGRLWQLRETLIEHIHAFNGRTDVEIVVLNYNSPDGLHEWIGNHPEVLRAIRAGLVTYARESSVSFFHASRAKNLAHRLSRGTVLVNLDADNWAAEMDGFLRHAFEGSDGVICHGHNGTADGSFGRIGLSRRWFYQLGGYDESMQPTGHEDADLLDRALAIGLRRFGFESSRRPIRNSASDKTSLTVDPDSLGRMLAINRLISDANLARRRYTANLSGWGAATVQINFASPVSLPAILPRPVRTPGRVHAARHADIPLLRVTRAFLRTGGPPGRGVRP